MRAQLRPALVVFVLLSAVTGVVYPLLVTGAAQVAFPRQANGSMVVRGGTIVGSDLIGQPFAAPGYFRSRPSATTPTPYNGGASSGSNLGPSNPGLRDTARERVEALRALDPGNPGPIPSDLVAASGSGLDPHVSPAAALYQVRRVAASRGLDEAAVRALVAAHTEGPQLGFLGKPRVHVLRLNLALDGMRSP
jgi:potassium-transporting ATPase KdpC subunit